MYGQKSQSLWYEYYQSRPYPSELTISESGVEPVSFNEFLERSDYLSIHAT